MHVLKQRSLRVNLWLVLWLIGAIASSVISLRNGNNTSNSRYKISRQLSKDIFYSTSKHAIPPTSVTLSRPSATSSINNPKTEELKDSSFVDLDNNLSFVFTSQIYNVSIPENSMGKTYVVPTEKMGIHLHNSKEPFEDIRFKIMGGDKDKFFKAEDRTVGNFCFLTIRTRTGNIDVLNRERQDSYLLDIQATANRRIKKNKLVPLEAHTSVAVKILDTNDLIPLFDPTEYEATVTEDTPLHKKILKVAAEDADLGINGEFYYIFSEMTDQFAIHPVSGEITLTRPLRYVDRSSYDLKVLALDRVTTHRNIPIASSCSVKVNVRQVNLHSPEISVRYLPEIVENSNANVYAVVNIIDRDTGIHGEIKSLEIVSGDPDGFFRIVPNGNEPGEFSIMVLHTLDRESAPQGYNLTLKATDRGTPQKVTYKSIPVHLIDANDNAPIFSREVYEVKIPETAPINSPIIRLKVADPDYGKNSLAFLEIVGGNKGNEFYINADTGMLYTNATLDAETKTFYTLTVSAIDQGNVGTRKQSSAKVKIYIIDTNDNDPEFDASDKLVYLNENEPAGTSVTKVLAKDKDSGENAYISYSIDNIRSVPFEIDHFSGIIKTRQVLDYETMKRDYILHVRASDWGLPYRRQTEMRLRVKLKDVNDNRPQFEKVDCSGHVSRHLAIGTEIITVSAIDFDSGNIISYRIVSGNADGCFSLDTTSGVLSVACDLSDLNVNERVINVTATDGSHFADVNSISIHLVNTSKAKPWQSKILTNETGNFECRDTGVARRLTDAIASAEKNNAPFQNEELAMMPSRYGENIYAPEFIDFPIEIRVNESAPIGFLLVAIKARDRDRGYNGKLVFGISEGDVDSSFGIDADNGELRLIGRLDREHESNYYLNITVYDLGKPQKASSKMLPIIVLDVNDNPPKFAKSVVTFSVSEDARNGTVILKANATDADLGENAKIGYSLITDTNDFKIDRESGVLSVNNLLDRERQGFYELRIRATDSAEMYDLREDFDVANPPLYSEAVIKITIEDVNDNPPQFSLSTYSVKVREDIPIWSVVAIIEASDLDEGLGGIMDYSFSNETESETYFFIDRLTGTVRTAKSLDFEDRQVHAMTVVATDRGEPTLSSEATFIVEIVDVNENMYDPVFSDFVVSARLKENQPVGTTVTTVKAKDLDPPGPDSKVGYSIRGGDGIGFFSIDAEGNIKTKVLLDVETKSGYWLTIYAQDHGVVPRSSKLEVYIEVLDENDNVPLTELPVYYPSVMENSPAGVSVLHIKAFDKDVSHQHFTFSITGGNPEGYFLINETTGLISTSGRKLDRENQDEYILEVTVRDTGIPPLSSTTQVVVQVEDANDHGPEFEQKFYIVQIPATQSLDKPLFQKSEKEPSRDLDISFDSLLENGTWETFNTNELSGDYAFRVLAHDEDIGKNGNVIYSIKSGKGKGKFKIHPDTGMVYSQKPFEANQEFDMIIRASDEGDPPRSHQARITVQVVDVPPHSKNPPTFKAANQTVMVTESDKVGFLVALIQASDVDRDLLWFNIIDGDPRNEFYIGSDSGNVLLAKQLDWETKNFYNLTISVTDGVNTDKANLYIKVIDINDNRPQFTESVYKVQISENVIERGEGILQLQADDLDEDKRLFYSLHSAQSQSSLEIFQVDSLTGVISLTQSLDREILQEHILTVMVRDQGTPAKRNYARVIITVFDHNDHAPYFINEIIQGKVYETATVGTAVVEVLAIDRDHGDNAKISYSVTSGNVGNVFSMDPDLGVIRVARQLDINVASEYILLVKATDNGSPALSNTVPVHIMVTMADNAAPKFIQKNGELAAEIYENQPAGTFVINIEVRSTSSLLFEIIHGNQGDLFFINPSTGIIATQDQLDYEKTKFYNLTIMVTNMASVSAKSNVLVHVLDRNDNAPKFLQAEYFGEASEDGTVGSLVFTANGSTLPLVIKAEDADSESNALLNYEIVDDLAKKFFHIDSSTGAIRTVMLLDYETIPEFKFSVKVSDLGKPKLSSEIAAKVNIIVKNTNDCPPVFAKSSYNATVLLPTWKNVAVLTIYAYDPDNSIKNETVTKYDIIDGNYGQAFKLDAYSGAITINNTENIRNKYILHIRASDGKYSSLSQVIIKVEKSESSGLVFQKNVYEGSIQENSTKISTVTVVNILGTALNEQIIFSILNPTDMFAIGATSGAIRTTGKKFDRESQDNYELIIRAETKDPVHRVAHTIVNVAILDINDNCPIFVNLPYYSVVPVDEEKGYSIMKVHAIDLDSGENGEVRYELKKGHGELFKVSRKSGEISLKQNLEGHNREYSLTIAAYDGGITPCSVEVLVNLKVIDRSMPIFDKQFYTGSVLENIEINSPLSLSINASSPLNRKLIYTITKGNDFEEFALDFNTGVIYVVDELDYETIKQYELIIRATDSISGVYAEVLVNILVLDVNDCPPEFSQDFYNVSVSESALFGTAILKVTARDNDTGINKKIRYAIESSENDIFHIDADEGIVFLKRFLDHEATDSHHFTVIAMDRGVPSLSSTAHVWITVLDVNDSPPSFEQQSYSCFLSEEAERGQFVTVVTASDPDILDEKLSYAIVGGNDQQTFTIDQSTGIITLINMQNFADEKLSVLNVSVTDGVYTTFARVKVEILPANRHHPKFDNPIIETLIPENQKPGKLITTVAAVDKDFGEYGAIEYSIESDHLKHYFEIDKRTGQIVTKKYFDREQQKLYEIPVMATDGGGKSGFVIVRVKVTDENDNAPVFPLKDYKVCIYSNLSVNSNFLKIKAYDLDEEDNARIVYSIYEPQNSKMKAIFNIDTLSGALYLNSSVKALENQLFQFFVRAQDKGTPSRHSDVSVEVYVMNSQNVPPLFERVEEKFFVSETSALGIPITRLKVLYNLNSTVNCRIISAGPDFPFSINPTTCTVSLSASLDREAKDSYLIGVLAETDSSPPLTALAEITLQVLDENDHAPKFESNPYFVAVAENVEQGSLILKVVAHDSDLGSNSEVRYSFGSDIGELANIFTIDPYTGWISTLVELDKERQGEYKFQVVATDNGFSRHFSRTTIQVKLQDYNDHSPRFDTNGSGYRTKIKEDALPGTVVSELATIDDDIDLRSPVNFYIISGDSRSQFQIRSSGQIYVAKSLDRENIDHYVLKIVGTDGKFVFYTTLYVEILDVNDNPPYCLKYRYKEVLSEGSHPGSYVLTVLAADYDDQQNAKLRFYLTGANKEKFLLDKETGVLKTIGQLDRELQSKYLLTAHVQDRDKPTWECSSQLEISISDLNDNSPKFNMPFYTATLPEDVEVGTLVTKIHATDADLGINRKIKYEFIDSSNDHFSISPDSGIVRLLKPLDRETKAFYNLTVSAVDQGTPQLMSLTSLIINVLDINDNPPEFTSKFYHARVPEINGVGSEIARVLATSQDTGINADIFYSIVGGNEHKKFQIDRKTGIISIAEQLDYERAKDYLLTVQAIDGGVPPLTNHATVNITVIDSNDNAPVFNQASYRVSVREDAKVLEKITQVFADDSDSGDNGKVYYSIERGDRLKQFSIDKYSGEIFIALPLDREQISFYALEVHAQDNGIPTMSSYVIVNIEILDANDNPPFFSQVNYTTVVQEDKPIGYIVMKFVVTDADVSPNTEPFTFDFRSGNEQDAFRLEQDGTLRTSTKFNNRLKNKYALNIRVFDNGSPPLYSDTWVVVKIIEESQYPPVITLLEIYINSYLDKYPGGIIGRIHASDKDQYDTLSYSLVPTTPVTPNNQLFEIDRHDGTIVALPMLDVGDYHVNVSVTDGKFFSHSTVKIFVDLITDDMLSNSVVVRFREASPQDFILKHRKGLIKTLKTALKCRIKDIFIISVQPSTEADYVNVIKSRNKRQAINNDLDVLFAVKKTNPSELYSSESIRESLNQHVEELEASTKLVVEEIVRHKCSKSHCAYGECQEKIILDAEKIMTVSTDVISFVSPRHRLQSDCICKEGYAGTHCEMIVNECARNPCPSFKKCAPDASVHGYSCECAEGYTGLNCEMDLSKCHEESCYLPKHPISFSGKSYARYKIDKVLIGQTIENRLSLSLRIRTMQPTGNLMYATGKVDYNVLELVNGLVQYKFDLGSGEGLVRVSSIFVSDGQWHEIQLEREKNSATLTIDKEYIAHGSAPGRNDILNLQSDELYLGAEVRQHPSILGFEDVQRGFVGCMDDVKIGKILIPLHMSGSSNVVVLKRFANVEFSCEASLVLVPPGLCGSQPCQNGGSCKELLEDKYHCECHDRFKGLNCEIDTDPCASSPCLYGGKCKLIAGSHDFMCECLGSNLSGKRCEFGRYCSPNPCLNGGVCEEGNSGPVCKCEGFFGERCENDIDECEANPCSNGGTCSNEIGSYKCLCPILRRSGSCGNSVGYSMGNIVRHLSISWEQLTWIGIALGANILLIIIFVTFRKIRSKRVRNNTNNINNKPKKDVVLNSAKSNDHEFKRSSKLSNLEVVQREPPQCPPRPLSYTPSSNNDNLLLGGNYTTGNNAASVTLNNLDTLRSYGSAGDELENVPPDYLKNLNRRTPVPSPIPLPTLSICNANTSNTISSENDGILKSMWQDQMHLASFISDGSKIKNDLKGSSPVLLNAKRRPLMHMGGASIASLSSMEEDPRIVGGYHWDCSDWVRPSQNPLPNITEVPGSEVPDSSSFHSNESNESNTHHQMPLLHSSMDSSRDIETLNEDQESEYVGDTDCGTELSDHYHLLSAAFPENQKLNPLDSGGEIEYKCKDSDSYIKHPNTYLPHYNIHSDIEINCRYSSHNVLRVPNGRLGVRLENFGSDDDGGDEPEQDDEVVPYGFPSVRRNRRPRSNKVNDNDKLCSLTNVPEERNLLLGGANSNSDLSTNLCEIDDSEFEINERTNGKASWPITGGVTQTSV